MTGAGKTFFRPSTRHDQPGLHSYSRLALPQHTDGTAKLRAILERRVRDVDRKGKTRQSRGRRPDQACAKGASPQREMAPAGA